MENVGEQESLPPTGGSVKLYSHLEKTVLENILASHNSGIPFLIIYPRECGTKAGCKTST